MTASIFTGPNSLAIDKIDMATSRAHVYVHGRVQGVSFRASMRHNAQLFGVKGWVKNGDDGSVEAVFEGKKAAVDNIVSWCRQGPSGALVQRLDVCWEECVDEFDRFSIVY